MSESVLQRRPFEDSADEINRDSEDDSDLDQELENLDLTTKRKKKKRRRRDKVSFAYGSVVKDGLFMLISLQSNNPTDFETFYLRRASHDC